MKAIVYSSRNGVELAEKKIPILGEHDVLLEVVGCGICGTDLHIISSGKGSTNVPDQTTLGHEFSGKIVEVGAAVKDYAVGEFVAVDPNMYCGKCDYCKDHQQHLCRNLKAYGVNLDGGFAEYARVNHQNLYKVNPDKATEALLMEPLACCLHGIDQLSPQIGTHAIVIGLGPIGLLMCHLLKTNGLKVIGLDISVSKLNEARKLGIECYLSNNFTKKFNHQFDYVIETTGGHQSAISMCIQVAKKGAKLLFFSVPQGDVKIDLRSIFEKELHIHGSFINPGTNQRALNLINDKESQFETFISHRFPLEQFEEALAMAKGGNGKKIVLTK